MNGASEDRYTLERERLARRAELHTTPPEADYELRGSVELAFVWVPGRMAAQAQAAAS